MITSPKKNSMLCPNCRKLISRSVKRCPHCNIANPAAWWKNTFLSSARTSDEYYVKAIIYLNVAMFVLLLLADFRPSSMNFSPFAFLSPSNNALLLFGSTGTVPLFQLDRWWTLVSANYLHGSLLHILFNMLAFSQLAPFVQREFGNNRMIVIYTLGGVAGYLLSAVAGVRFTIGASAAVCSLIGALLYYGKSRGGSFGQAVFTQIGGWAIGIALFGFLVPGINNWGHGGGMAAGALLGYLLGYRDRRKESMSQKYLAMTCIVVTVFTMVWAVFSGLFLLFQ